MDNRPIGIFDSGLGGLTAVKALRKLLPDENIVYFADSGRVPYGPRPVSQLRRMAVQDMDFAASKGAKAIIAACGTVSSNAPDLLDGYPVPVFGVLRSAVRAMSYVPGDRPLGVIATEASIKSGAFYRALQPVCHGREILCVPCPAFVPLIESGHSAPEDGLVQEAVEKYLHPMREAGVSAILLGCTHFGIIGRAIGNFMGRDTQLIDAADCAAAELAEHLIRTGMTGGSGETRYYTSGDPREFSALAATFLGHTLESPVEPVPVMEV